MASDNLSTQRSGLGAPTCACPTCWDVPGPSARCGRKYPPFVLGLPPRALHTSVHVWGLSVPFVTVTASHRHTGHAPSLELGEDTLLPPKDCIVPQAQEPLTDQ